MQVLVIGYVWPEPNSSAAGAHMLSLLTLFREQDWKVTFASPAVRSEHRHDLSTLNVKECDIALNCDSFDSFVTELNPDIVLFDRFMMEEQFGWRVAEQCPNALRIIDTEDLHFVRHARHQAFKQKRDTDAKDWQSELALREMSAIYRSDLSLIISDQELAFLNQQLNLPKELLHYCPFMLDVPEHESPGLDSRQHFVTIGNFRHAPNWDAVLWLSQSIWPKIRAQLPGAELHIYGAYPPPKATALHSPKKGFHIKGWADDAQAVMSSARVCLAPLRFGAGIKGKLTEAMLCGTPSVTTTVGAEGIQGNLAWPGNVCDEEQSFIDAAIQLYQDDTLWQKCQQRGYQLLNQRFNKANIAKALIERIISTKQDLEAHRHRNIVGAMLRHHQHKSTQYMSQWIAAKNKLD